MFRQYDLELQSKDGETLDYRSIDWNRPTFSTTKSCSPPAVRT